MNADLYPMTVLYDAACPVCSLEMDHLWERNAAGRLAFVDISAEGFDPRPYGITLQAMHEEIHAITAGGEVLHGVQVLRLAYEAVGLGWVLKPVGWAPLRPAFEWGYRWFARHRRSISSAAAPLVRHIRKVRAARTAVRMQACRNSGCHLHRGD